MIPCRQRVEHTVGFSAEPAAPDSRPAMWQWRGPPGPASHDLAVLLTARPGLAAAGGGLLQYGMDKPYSAQALTYWQLVAA